MRLLITCALVLSGQVAAAAPTWVDWVGDYKATLVWRQCTAPGEKTATISVDAVDGAMRIDLAPGGAALRAMSLSEDDGTWSAQDGDVTVRVSRKKPNHVDLAIEIGSTCTVRGALQRAASITACDRLLAWSRIEARCTKTTAKLEDFAALVKTKWKKTDALRCEARSEKLELAMVDAGCAPHPDPNIGTRAVEYRGLVDATRKLARCGRVPNEITTRLTNAASALSAASQTADKSTLPYVERQCKDARTEVTSIAVQFQCQL